MLKFPELVKTNDWVQLEKVSGIRTNSFALEAMRQRCTDVALQCPPLQANGLSTLKAKLRSTAPDAPRSVHRPPTLSVNLGTPAPLPLAQVAGSPSTVTGAIHQLEMQIDSNSYTASPKMTSHPADPPSLSLYPDPPSPLFSFFLSHGVMRFEIFLIFFFPQQQRRRTVRSPPRRRSLLLPCTLPQAT